MGTGRICGGGDGGGTGMMVTDAVIMMTVVEWQ